MTHMHQIRWFKPIGLRFPFGEHVPIQMLQAPVHDEQIHSAFASSSERLMTRNGDTGNYQPNVSNNEQGPTRMLRWH